VATEGGRPGDAFLPVLDALGTMITASSDADRARLEAIWDAYEQMQRPGRLAIDVPPLTVAITWPAAVRDQVVRSVQYYRLPRIQLALRIGRLDEALAELESLRHDARRSAMAWKLTAIAHARKGDFDAAQGAIDEARRRLPENTDVEAIAAQIAEAARIAAEPAVDEVSAAIRDAHVARVLGAPQAARERLEPLLLADPGDLALERRFDLAREVVARSRLAAPEQAAQLDALSAQLAELEARTPGAPVLSNQQ
jgi:hypothetical protein